MAAGSEYIRSWTDDNGTVRGVCQLLSPETPPSGLSATWRGFVFGGVMTFAEQLKHPKWQQKRLEVMQRCGFMCINCEDKNTTLHIHHPFYRKGAKLWEYETDELLCLCEKCHQETHAVDSQIRSEITDLQLMCGMGQLSVLLGWLKGANYTPYTKLESYEEICGFLDYFNIPRCYNEIINMIIESDGYPDKALNAKTSFLDIGTTLLKKYDSVDALFKEAEKETLKRIDSYRSGAE